MSLSPLNETLNAVIGTINHILNALGTHVPGISSGSGSSESDLSSERRDAEALPLPTLRTQRAYEVERWVQNTIPQSISFGSPILGALWCIQTFIQNMFANCRKMKDTVKN